MPMFNSLPWYASGVAASPDGKRLVVSSVTDSHVYVLNIDPTSPTLGKQLGSVDLGQHETYGAYFDPPESHRIERLRVRLGRPRGGRDRRLHPERAQGQPHVRHRQGSRGRHLPGRPLDGRRQRLRRDHLPGRSHDRHRHRRPGELRDRAQGPGRLRRHLGRGEPAPLRDARRHRRAGRLRRRPHPDPAHVRARRPPPHLVVAERRRRSTRTARSRSPTSAATPSGRSQS